MTSIFIETPSQDKINRSYFTKVTKFVGLLLFRIVASFTPPFIKKYRKIHVDLVGPVIALVVLIIFVNYGSSYRINNNNNDMSSTKSLLLFSALMPGFCFILSRFIGDSPITFIQTLSLIGYGLYGHLFTLLVSFVLFQENSNVCFFICLIIFGGLSTLRISMIILNTISLPVVRLLICTLISVVNILFIVFLHFVYMHRTYVYKTKELIQ